MNMNLKIGGLNAQYKVKYLIFQDMKVKYADRIYTVSEIKETGGITWYGIEDEPNHIDWVHDVEIVDTREDIMKEAVVEKYGNDTCRAAEHFMKGMEYAFDYALQEAKHVIIEHFGVDDKYADEVDDLFNQLDERLGR